MMSEERFNYYAAKALNEFQAQYPLSTSGDLQAFTLGLQEGFKIGIYGDVEKDYQEETKFLNYLPIITNSGEDEEALQQELYIEAYKKGL
jgi:hypothetical protein